MPDSILMSRFCGSSARNKNKGDCNAYRNEEEKNLNNLEVVSNQARVFINSFGLLTGYQLLKVEYTSFMPSKLLTISNYTQNYYRFLVQWKIVNNNNYYFF